MHVLRFFFRGGLLVSGIFCLIRLPVAEGSVKPSQDQQVLREQRTDITAVVELHTVFLAVENDIVLPDSVRIQQHEKEKGKLLERLNRHHGSWSASHPRHRLLDALHGFTKYAHRQQEEIDRLRGLYKHMSKSQKLVSLVLPFSHSISIPFPFPSATTPV
jgi:hypothetical protein